MMVVGMARGRFSRQHLHCLRYVNGLMDSAITGGVHVYCSCVRNQMALVGAKLGLGSGSLRSDGGESLGVGAFHFAEVHRRLVPVVLVRAVAVAGFADFVDQDIHRRETGADEADSSFRVTSRMLISLGWNAEIVETYPERITHINITVALGELPSFKTRISRYTLKAVASPPADNMPMTRSFLLRDICSDQVSGNGRTRIIISVTTLITESAIKAAR